MWANAIKPGPADIRDLFAQKRATFSFEFFPPKTPEGAEELYKHITDLEQLRPSFVSVTYGAGGSTRDLTHNLVVRLKTQTPLDPMPHLTCVGHDEKQIDDILQKYAEAGINKILALRGDPPKVKPGESIEDPYKHFKQASDLVSAIKKFNDAGRHPNKRGFAISVAGFPEGHPDTPNRVVEIERMKAKCDAGADFIVTQLFFDNHDFFDYRDRCGLAGIDLPIIAGIMPITSMPGMRKMADLALGARYPAPLLRALNRTGGDEGAVRRVGVHWATEQCRDLLDHRVAGLHFYTLNRSTATKEIYATLGVQNSLDLA